MIGNGTSKYGKAVAEYIGESWFQNLAIAILIILIGLIVARIVSRLMEKMLVEIELDNIIHSATGYEAKIAEALTSFSFYFLAFISLIMALNQLGITTTILQILASAILLLVIISVALGIKDFIPNSFAGLTILRKKTIKEGDIIEVHKIKGKVKKINLNETQLITKRGDIINIPNASLLKKEFTKKKN